MEKLIAKAHFKHDDKQLHPQDEFEATEYDAADLIAMGFAERAKNRTYRRRDLRAEH